MPHPKPEKTKRKKKEREREKERERNATIKGSRFLGRSRNRWEETVRNFANQLPGIRNWIIMTDRREDWRRKLGEVKVRFGLQRLIEQEPVNPRPLLFYKR